MFNSSEFHFFGSTSYEIHTLAYLTTISTEPKILWEFGLQKLKTCSLYHENLFIQKVKVISTQVLNNFFSASDIMEAVRGRFHFYGINYKGCVIQVVLLRNKWVEQLLVYFYNTAVENNFLIITSFSDFILSYNSKNRHLEFLNLSPQGLISSFL